MKGYYFITDERLSAAGTLRNVKDALSAGVKVIQYRNKGALSRTLYEEALALRRICKKAALLINDRIDIALAVNADGVHIGQDDMPFAVARSLLGKNKIIGITVHDLRQALIALRQGADYLGVSPIFTTGTKVDAGQPVGISLIERIREHGEIPIVAIGGINLSNAQSVIRAGADSICAISAVVTKKDIKGEIKKFQRLFDEVNKTKP
ncbi:MAG: thiamine phosphate synthase [Candidatus Omnitrophica bacterium]|nr:thiamine phosphate synthase [Candidatus Omnitrophota bacterium]